MTDIADLIKQTETGGPVRSHIERLLAAVTPKQHDELVALLRDPDAITPTHLGRVMTALATADHPQLKVNISTAAVSDWRAKNL